MKGCKISNDKKKTLHVSQRIPVYSISLLLILAFLDSKSQIWPHYFLLWATIAGNTDFHFF